ncbi:MAG: DUF4038 domain-containing protein [Armatimonadota bacterium]
MDEVARWDVHEIVLESEREYDEPLWDATLTALFTSPSGREREVEGFWDGDRSWLVRFCPDEVGTWRWRTRRSVPDDSGLHGREGRFACAAYEGTNPLVEHGPLSVAGDRRHLEHADGTPFFWLADTAWNGVLRARPEEWEEYLVLRLNQRFTAVQFVATQWRGWPEQDLVFSNPDRVSVEIGAFRRMDAKIAAVNKHGLVAAPVMLWTLTESDPGQVLSEQSAIRLCRYMRARWGAHNVVWLLGGDGRYKDEEVAERWRRIGRAVFGEDSDRPVTMHPCGMSWVGDEFGGEPWFDFLGYQSGHALPEKTSRWIAMGPPAEHWRELELPIINLEPNYEDHPAYGSDYRISPPDVRRAAWLSLLVTPTAGVSYGTNPVWAWSEARGPAPGHEGLGEVGPWREGLERPGISGMTALAQLMDQIEWWRLRPAQDLLLQQPGEADPRDFIAVAATDDRDLVVAYTPAGDAIHLQGDLPGEARWYDPREGGWQAAAGEDGHFDAPAEGDWVLVLGAEAP